MIYQSIVHCIACYSNLHMYTFILQDIMYIIKYLHHRHFEMYLYPTSSYARAAVNQLVNRAIKPPHDSLGECYGNGYVMVDL